MPPPGHLLLHELLGQPHRVPPPLQRELRLGAAHQEDVGELEALRLVHGQDVDRVLVEVGLGHRRVVPGLAQQVEVRDERGHAVVLGHVAVGLHHLEEAGDVPDLRLGLGRGLLRQPPQEARPLQEAVEHLAGAPPRHLAGRPLEIGEEPRGRVAGLARDRGEVLVLRQAAEHLEERARLAPRVVVEPEEVPLGHPVDLGRHEVEERDRVVGVGEDAQERHEEAHLLARVETAAAAEAVREALDVERPEERVGVGIAAHEDREVPRPGARLDPLRDHRGVPSASADTVSKCAWRTGGPLAREERSRLSIPAIASSR